MNSSLRTAELIESRFKKSGNHHLSNKKTEAEPSTNNESPTVFPNGVCIALVMNNALLYSSVYENTEKYIYISRMEEDVNRKIVLRRFLKWTVTLRRKSAFQILAFTLVRASHSGISGKYITISSSSSCNFLRESPIFVVS